MNKRDRNERRPVARHRAFRAFAALDEDQASLLVVVDCYWDAFVLDQGVEVNGLTSCPTCEALVNVSRR